MTARDHQTMTRRGFVARAAAGAAVTAVPAIAGADDPLRSIGLDVSVIAGIQARASQDLGFPVSGQALGYGEMFSAMLHHNDRYDVAEGYYNDMDAMWPAGVWQPVDTHRIMDWDRVSDLAKTGRLTPQSRQGEGDAPFRHLWVDAGGRRSMEESRYVTMVPDCHNADSIGYNPESTGRPIESWAALLNEDFAGRVSLINVPQVGAMDAALAVEAAGLHEFADKANMTPGEIDALVAILVERKKAGHFGGLWESTGESVDLMVTGAVALGSMWSPAVTAARARGIPCVYASPAEGLRGWHGGLAISSKATGRALDRAYDYINWWLSGWAGAFVARHGYYMSVPDNVKRHLEPEEWDFWYAGKPARRNLPDPYGTIVVRKGEVRDGGSYWDRFSNIAVWNSLMDENGYLVERWNEFLAA